MPPPAAPADNPRSGDLGASDGHRRNTLCRAVSSSVPSPLPRAPSFVFEIEMATGKKYSPLRRIKKPGREASSGSTPGSQSLKSIVYMSRLSRRTDDVAPAGAARARTGFGWMLEELDEASVVEVEPHGERLAARALDGLDAPA